MNALPTNKQKNKARRLFLAGTAIAGGVFFALTVPPAQAAVEKNGQGRDVTGLCADNPRKNAGRTLTQSEAGLLRLIFNKEIDITRVRIHNDIHQNPGITAFVEIDDPCNIVMSNLWLHRVTDFTQVEHLDLLHVFVHEATHLWHYGLRKNQRADWNPTLYDYSIGPMSRFADYTMEQQAEIIADYARVFLYAAAPRKKDRSAQEKENIRRIVETAFPWVQKNRESFTNCSKRQTRQECFSTTAKRPSFF